jgi:predicted DCC family thiol-disulfide oxidoreductase YuxK
MELPGPVALFDGECSICDTTVRFLLRRDAHGRLRFASLQGETAAALRAERADFPRDLATMVLAEPAPGGGLRLLLNSDGIARAIELTGSTGLARALRLVPRPVRDLVYRVFARNRYRLFGRKDACDLPAPEDRAALLP